MENVYDLVDAFYQNKNKTEQVIARDIVEKYLRQKAWHGHDEDSLCFYWISLREIMNYIEEFDLYGIISLGPFDHLEVLYRIHDAESDFSLTEDNVKAYFALVADFLTFLSENYGDEKDDALADLRDSERFFYLQDVFLLPERHGEGEFYSSLDMSESVEAEDIEKLNAMLDDLLQRVGLYFRREEYQRDFNRAISLYVGPDGGTDDEESTMLGRHEEFWQGFWDYFLFDYHLLDTDETPLYAFFFLEREHLTLSEQDVIRDLLHSEFRIFYVTSLSDEMAHGRDLFTDEPLELPATDWMRVDIEHMIFFGHMRMHGIMMLNYVTALPASAKLRTRMKEILERELELYRCQDPGASMEAFFRRESAAVRHILHIMSSFAQLNLLTIRELPQRQQVPESVSRLFEKARENLVVLAIKLGFSRFGAKLLTTLFDDYLCVAEIETSPYELSSIVTACIIAFGNLNGLHFDEVPNIKSMLNAPEARVDHHIEGIRDRLKCETFDPRYLMEEGFVFSLYYT